MYTANYIIADQFVAMKGNKFFLLKLSHCDIKLIMDYLIVIPALNPKSDLTDYVDSLLANGYSNILVVDDGSREDCSFIFDAINAKDGCRVYKHDVNLGKGRSLKDAMNIYMSDYRDSLGGMITVDSDGQHVVEDVAKIASAMSANNNSLIMGARDFSLDNVPWKSRFGNKCTVTALKLFIGGNISDTQTGLRGIPNNLIDRFRNLPGDRFEYETVMLIDAISTGCDIIEVPIRTVYIDNNSETHFHPVIDSFKIYKVILGTFFKYILSSLSSFLIDYGLFCGLFYVLSAMSWPQSRSIWVSTVAARILSSLFNYTVNKKIVFNSSKGPVTLIMYYLLCVIQMAASAGLVSLVSLSGTVIVQLAKIIVDTLLFLISYRIQKKYIFGTASKKRNK